MTGALVQAWHSMRQLLVPAAFRIDAPPLDAALIKAFLDPRSETPEIAGLDDRMVVTLGNEVHRLRVNRAQLGDAGPNLDAVSDRMARSLDRVLELLESHGIAVADLSGQVYDPGRRDFEPASNQAETVPGLVRPTIQSCLRPAISRDGRLIQPAKGFVGIPPE